MELKKTVFLGLCYLLSLPLFADEPPVYGPFKIGTDTSEYFAWVIRSNEVDSLALDDEGWELQVYEQSEGDSILMWKTEFYYTDYQECYLNDDGTAVAAVEYFYTSYAPLVVIYREAELEKRLWHSYFPINEDDLVETESHALWLDMEQPPVFRADKKDLWLMLINDIPLVIEY